MNLMLKRGLAVVLLSGLAFSGHNSASAQVKNLSGVDSTVFISHTIFLPKNAYDSGMENWGLALGDVDHDGDVDIVSASQLDSKVNVHLNNGKGKFGPATSYAAGNFNRQCILADFNNDTWLDIATVSIKDNRLNWLMNDGTGKFLPQKGILTGAYPHDLTAADVNGDGNLDIVTVLNTDNKVSIHTGDGKGNFTGALGVITGGKPRSVEVYDINTDGMLDLLVSCDDRCVYIHYGLGAGKFKPGTCILSGSANWGLGIGDFDKNGHPDIATADYFGNQLCIHLNQGAGKFDKAVCVPSGDFNFDLVVGDFDLDGDLDVVTASTRDEQINVHLNDGKGVFSPKAKIASGNWNSTIAAADLDGDKDLDLVTSSIKDNKVNVHRNISINPEEAPTATCVYGTITDKKTGAPLKAIVAIVGTDGFSVGSTVSGPDGKYKICDIPFGKGYTLSVKAGTYPKYTEGIDLPESLGKNGLQKDVALEKPEATFVYGSVIDMDTREPLPGTDIVIKDQGGNVVAKLVADEQGKYKTSLPFANNYEIQVTKQGYNEKSALFNILPTDYPNGVEKNFELQKMKPKTTACIKGHVLDEKTKEKLPGATVAIMDEQGNLIKKVETDGNGYYEACNVPFGKYDLSATKKGYMFKLDSAVVGPEHIETGVTRDIELLKLEVGMSIVLKNIYYDVAKATLRPESTAELDRLITIMNQNPTLVVELSGHTDSDGSDSYNLNLSQNRAQSVVDYLLGAGIAPERLVAKGYGETMPIVPNDTKENKQLNRRTEFKVLAF